MAVRTLALLVRDEGSVVARVVGLLNRRDVGVRFLNLAPAGEPGRARMTVSFDVEDVPLRQLTGQLGRLVDVLAVEDVTDREDQ